MWLSSSNSTYSQLTRIAANLGESRVRGQKMVCNAYAYYKGAYPAWSSRFGVLDSLSIYILLRGSPALNHAGTVYTTTCLAEAEKGFLRGIADAPLQES
jgi:hypothetical protein